jgi:translation initiation factor IF-3
LLLFNFRSVFDTDGLFQVKLERAREFFGKGHNVQITVEKRPLSRAQKKLPVKNTDPPEMQVKKAWEIVESTIKDMDIQCTMARKSTPTLFKLVALMTPAAPPKEAKDTPSLK